MNDDSSDDDDDYHVPHNWSGYDFSKLSVNEGEAVSWEYRQNEVCIGSVYGNSDNMKEAIKCWSTHSLQRQFKVVKSSPRTYDVRCVRSDCFSGCTLLRASSRISERSEKLWSTHAYLSN